MALGRARTGTHRSPPRLTLGEAVAAVALLSSVVTFALMASVWAPSEVSRASGRQPGGRVPTLTPTPPAQPRVVPPRGRKIPAPPRGELYWGAYVPGVPYDTAKLEELERVTGHAPAIMMWYQSWQGSPLFAANEARRLEADGIIPMLTWQPRHRVGNPIYVTLRDIVRGRYDGYIRRYARSVRNFGLPIFIRLMHEMDGSWYPWSGYSRGNTPEVWVATWRHIHDLFREEGAKNVTWVWSVNHRSVPHIPANRIERYWPGSRYVDWIGISGFNPGPVRVPFKWRSFDQVNRSRYLELLKYGKPIMIAETAAPEVGGNKTGWVRRMFRSIITRYPQLRALIWFDDFDPKFPSRNDWRINSSKPALDAFRHFLDGPHVLSAPAGMRITERVR